MDIKMIVCKSCGVAVVRTGSCQKWCTMCRPKMWKTTKRKLYEKTYVPVEPYIQTANCRDCGIEIVKRYGTQKICSSCRDKNLKSRERKYANREIKTLADGRVLISLRKLNGKYRKMPPSLFPKELIDLQREYTLLNRKLRSTAND